jgi:hypothetical protein
MHDQSIPRTRSHRQLAREAACLVAVAIMTAAPVAFASPGNGPLGGELMKLVGWAQWTLGLPVIAGGLVWAAMCIFGVVLFKAQVIAQFLAGI